jgi:hypothetical protein
MGKVWQWWRPVVLAGLLSLGVGCCTWGAPYAFPTWERVAAVAVNAPPDEVHAFRVDTVTTQQLGLREDSEAVLTPLPPGEEVGPVRRVALQYGLIGQVLTLPWGTAVSRGVSIRLYRRGYRLVEVEPGQPPVPIDWAPAPAFHEQCDALWRLTNHVRCAPVNAKHCEALRFIAEECERLAALAPEGAGYDRRYWLQTARQYRDQAERRPAASP